MQRTVNCVDSILQTQPSVLSVANMVILFAWAWNSFRAMPSAEGAWEMLPDNSLKCQMQLSGESDCVHFSLK